jgi:signal transduction histidine kinase
VVSLVSHEIKTPLLSIEGFSEMLCDTLEGETKGYAVIVQKESARLIRFLNTFLDISRIEGGQQPIRTVPVMLSDAVKEVARELRAVAEENGITLRAEMPEEISPVTIDRDLTKQCLINLIENAIKYSPPGKDVIIRLIEEIDHIRTEIIDHGIGIREEEVGKVFEKFYRAYSGDTRNIQGSGLGLTFVKEAVEAQGGKVSVKSRYGKGSKFSILFLKMHRSEGI